MNTKHIILVFLAVLAASIQPDSALLAEDIRTAGIKAFTRPSEDPMLSFVRAGRVDKVLVKKGDVVQADQLLVRLDDAAEQMQLAQLKAQTEDTSKINISDTDLKQKEVDLEKIEQAKSRGSATDWQVRKAQLDVEITKYSKFQAEFEHEQDIRAQKQAERQLERMKISSPIPGLVEEILVQRGESVDALADVVRVVKIDPLEIDVAVPLYEAAGLKPGRRAMVAFGGAEPESVEGRITHVAAVADAASKTRQATVRVPNPRGRPAGEWVKVSFPPGEVLSEKGLDELEIFEEVESSEQEVNQGRQNKE